MVLFILVSSAGKGFVAVVVSSRDGGGNSSSGAMCSVLHTRWLPIWLPLISTVVSQ
ncbi:hypothetical protein DEO72_LG9g1965 [Vigna unguiculata]|uniref:Uncharacterized protein n=1 Tax=Vigna unguiculata TaxID=3917 RepID=A0A4D6N271_VIGUN|nr:hypothetical protein DEO72_LG9g1965 [Vigna unguiculata]